MERKKARLHLKEQWQKKLIGKQEHKQLLQAEDWVFEHDHKATTAVAKLQEWRELLNR